MRNAPRWALTIIGLGFFIGCDWIGTAAGMKSSHSVEKAKVEQVFQAESNGHRFVAYVVTWRGSRVVVEDPLSKSHHSEGDEIQFMAQLMSLPGEVKILSFALLEP
jgi:hypothetical protein